MEEALRQAISPSAEEIRAAPLSTNAKIVAELIDKNCQRALDVGCGEGKFTRLLAKLCSAVSGIDVKERKIVEARDAARIEGLSIDFRVASGEELPFTDASLDLVVFSNSLHHIPHPDIALREAVRVLVPGGLVYIIEPVPAGTYQEATRLVNDETAVRTQAYRALLAMVADKRADVQSAATVLYRARRQFANFEEWKADQIDRDEKRRATFDAAPDLVRQTFEKNADKEDGRLVFDQVFRVNVLKKAPRAG